MNSTAPATIDQEYLNSLAIKYREEYAQGEPFPHIAIDNFFPEYMLDGVLEEFPSPEQIKWQKFNAGSERKLASASERNMGEKTLALLRQLNSSTFITFLETLTGIDGIIPDPHFEGGGLHQIERDGFLKIHADFNRNERLRLDRRLNLLVYLNKDWHEEYGGHFELWDREMTGCGKKVLPLFNRLVVFTTTDFSFHGHPEPLTCPPDRTRKSLALYYYTNGRPAHEVSKNGDHDTLFKSRPGEAFNEDEEATTANFKTVLKQFVPPILTNAIKGLK